MIVTQQTFGSFCTNVVTKQTFGQKAFWWHTVGLTLTFDRETVCSHTCEPTDIWPKFILQTGISLNIHLLKDTLMRSPQGMLFNLLASLFQHRVGQMSVGKKVFGQKSGTLIVMCFQLDVPIKPFTQSYKTFISSSLTLRGQSYKTFTSVIYKCS